MTPLHPRRETRKTSHHSCSLEQFVLADLLPPLHFGVATVQLFIPVLLTLGGEAGEHRQQSLLLRCAELWNFGLCLCKTHLENVVPLPRVASTRMHRGAVGEVVLHTRGDSGVPRHRHGACRYHCYHRVCDTAEKQDYTKMAIVAEGLAPVIRALTMPK